MTDHPPGGDAPDDEPHESVRGHRERYNRAELLRLASAQCDQSIAPADLQRLEKILAASPAARHEYVAYMDVHTGLDWEVTAAESVYPQSADTCNVTFTPSTKTNARRTARNLGAFGFAAALVIGAGVWWWAMKDADLNREIRPDKTAEATEPAVPVSVARISRQSAGCRWTVSSADGTAARRNVGDTQLRPMDTVVLSFGQVEITFSNGVEVTLQGSSVFQVISPMRAVAKRGKLTAHVVEGAEGFTIETPRAAVIDLGTVFGLEVDDAGQTDVVVFRGKVDLQYGRAQNAARLMQSRRLQMGEALRVDEQDEANRIMSIDSLRFLELEDDRHPHSRPPLIVGVQDNLRQADNFNYYEIVVGGMREDAKAFVDREFHEFNGVDTNGMPAYLIGGDYIKMFNDDKAAETIEVYVTLDRPARLFVLFDDRTPPPSWLTNAFRDTGDDVGMDVGEFTDTRGTWIDHYSPGVGPGVSVDNVLSVWERTDQNAGSIRLGSTQSATDYMNMYGIVAVPIAE